MSEAQAVRVTRFSLQNRIQTLVLALVLLMYLVALAVLGLPLRERAQQHLDLSAEQELSAVRAAIQDHARRTQEPSPFLKWNVAGQAQCPDR